MGKLWVGETNGCWLDIWDKPRFSGNCLRMLGPADFPGLRVGDARWSPQVRSITVGPNAYVQLYEDLNFHESVYWLLPNQRVDDFAELTCSDELDCIRVFDRPPFSHEPGYAAYMLWAAHHLANPSADRSKSHADGGSRSVKAVQPFVH